MGFRVSGFWGAGWFYPGFKMYVEFEVQIGVWGRLARCGIAAFCGLVLCLYLSGSFLFDFTRSVHGHPLHVS